VRKFDRKMYGGQDPPAQQKKGLFNGSTHPKSLIKSRHWTLKSIQTPKGLAKKWLKSWLPTGSK